MWPASKELSHLFRPKEVLDTSQICRVSLKVPTYTSLTRCDAMKIAATTLGTHVNSESVAINSSNNDSNRPFSLLPLGSTIQI